jgi:hypothetical protein
LAQGGVQAGTQLCGQRDGLRVAEDLDALLGLIEDHGAIFAVTEMVFQFVLQLDGKFTIDIIRDLANDAFAIQFGFLSRM